MQMGQTFSTEITTGFDGIEGDLTFTGEYEYSGVDAAGNDVYEVKSVRIAPESKIADGVLEKLSDEDQDKFWELMSKYTGDNIDSEAAVTEYYDDLNQKLATSFAGAVATVALAGAVADAENKQAKAQAQESYRRDIENKLMEQYLQEGPALDLMKKAAAAAVKGVGTVADKAVGGVTTTGMKAAQAAIKTGKAVGHEVGNKITVKKLMSLWKGLKSPTNVAGVVQTLKRAGMDDEMIGILNKETTKMDIDLTKTDAPKTDAPADDKKDAEVKPGDENPQNFIDVEALAKIIKANELDDEVRAILAKSAKAA